MSTRKIADLIQSRNEEVVQIWMDEVRRDSRIQSDHRLSSTGLRDHVPDLIEEACRLLRDGQIPRAANTSEARVHAYIRYRQGYRARDLVCEISLLRVTLLKIAAEFLIMGSVELNSFLTASEIINLYLDEELRYGISVYTEAEQDPPPPLTIDQ
jgi:hypothetical protein